MTSIIKSCGLGTIINVEEGKKQFLEVLYRRITRFLNGIQKLEIWESLWVTKDFGSNLPLL
jgi:hypothetical protein